LGGLGEVIKETREERGLSLAEVEEEIRIKQRLLAAIEAGDFDTFPSKVAARGLIRNYAIFLGLDPAEVLSRYDDADPQKKHSRRLATRNRGGVLELPISSRPLFTWDLVLGVLIVTALLGGAGLLIVNQYLPAIVTPTPTKTPAASDVRRNSAFTLPTPTLEPTLTPTPTPTPPPAFYTGVTVELAITERSWVQVLVDDVKAYEGVLERGEQRNWTGKKRVAIRAGNAGGVEVLVNGQSYGLMGAPGEVVDQVWEKLEAPPETSSVEQAEGDRVTSDPFGLIETATPTTP
jgi:cytoskeleton protein RodZ